MKNKITETCISFVVHFTSDVSNVPPLGIAVLSVVMLDTDGIFFAWDTVVNTSMFGNMVDALTLTASLWRLSAPDKDSFQSVIMPAGGAEVPWEVSDSGFRLNGLPGAQTEAKQNNSMVTWKKWRIHVQYSGNKMQRQF